MAEPAVRASIHHTTACKLLAINGRGGLWLADVRINVRLSYRPGVYDPRAIHGSQPGITARSLFNPNGDAIADTDDNQLKQYHGGADFAEKLLCT